MSDPTPDPFHAVDEAIRYFTTPYEPLPRGMAEFREVCTQPLREKIAELEAEVSIKDNMHSMDETRFAELEAEVERLKKANEGLVKGLAMVVAAAMEEEG